MTLAFYFSPMAGFSEFSLGKYSHPGLNLRFWTRFAKRIRPGAHRARIGLFDPAHNLTKLYSLLGTIYFQKSDPRFVIFHPWPILIHSRMGNTNNHS